MAFVLGAGSGAFAGGQLFNIFCGRFSDDSMSLYGRRRPFIFICAGILFIAFSLLWAGFSLGWPVCFMMSYFLIGLGIFAINTLAFSLLNDQLGTHQIGMAGGIAALLDVCSLVITTILVLVLVSDDATPYFCYVLCLIIACCIPYLFITEVPLTTPQVSASILDKAYRIFTDPSERDFLKSLCVEVFNGFQFASKPYAMAGLKDVMHVRDPADRIFFMNTGLLVTFGVALPMTIVLGKFIGESMQRVKLSIWAVAITNAMGIAVVLLMISPFVNDTEETNNVQKVLWYVSCVFNGVAYGFWTTVGGVLYMATLSNQHETAMSKTFRAPFAGAGGLIGSLVYGVLIMPWFKNDDSSITFNGFLVTFGVAMVACIFMGVSGQLVRRTSFRTSAEDDESVVDENNHLSWDLGIV